MLSRVLWLILSVAAAILGIFWSVEVGWILIKGTDVDELFVCLSLLQQTYNDRIENPTLNSLKTTGLPISEIDFPAITICGQGSIYEVLTNCTVH